MKKILLLLFISLGFIMTSCDDDDEQREPSYISLLPQTVQKESHTARIEKLYRVVMRREIPYPFKVYVLRLSNGKDVYMLRYKYNMDLYVGDEITYHLTTYCANEIGAINGVILGDGTGYTGDDDGDYDYTHNYGFFVSDPIEATVADVFFMDVCYSIRLFPAKTAFIITTDGAMIFIKNAKMADPVVPGDRIVYNVYRWWPNEVNAMKKLR